jgi:hypothetical protein
VDWPRSIAEWISAPPPDLSTRSRVPHHLIDLIDPDGVYRGARRADALAAIGNPA